MLLPSGRSVLLTILMEEFLAAFPSRQVIIVTRDKTLYRTPRRLKSAISILEPSAKNPIDRCIEAAASRNPDLLVVDRIDRFTAPLICFAAMRGMRVLSQYDTPLWGAHALRQLAGLGAPLLGTRVTAWVFSVLRLPTLCNECRRLANINPHLLQQLEARLPEAFTLGDLSMQVYESGGCPACHFTGRAGEVAVFDVCRLNLDSPTEMALSASNILPLETYLLGLVNRGQLTAGDLLNFQTDQLRRTYNSLAAGADALNQSTAALNRKLVELETAHRVLQRRTEGLISLQEISQAMVSSTSLQDLAYKVCRKASELSGAERSILYLRSAASETVETAEILAIHGWNPASFHTHRASAEVLNTDPGSAPRAYNLWPPGLLPQSRAADDSRVPFQAGLWIPLIAQENLVGVMLIHAANKNYFSPGEVALLQALADQAALAIQRTGLIEELRTRLEQLQAAQAELVKKERLEHELTLARQVQQSMLPAEFPDLPGFAFQSYNQPARQVGGDFFDVFTLDSDHFGLVIGDGSDKGMAAALYMALTRSLVRAEAQRSLSPARVLAQVNHLLLEMGGPRGFVSIFYGIVERSSGQLNYARAGHERPFLVRRGQAALLPGEGAVLGVIPSSELGLEERQIALEPGDRILLYTDGLTDAMNETGQPYDLQRLASSLASLADQPTSELLPSLLDGLHAHQGRASQFDDQTILVMEVIPLKEARSLT
jgi:serine phosphatase RsbU (regulator of sigma subunit)